MATISLPELFEDKENLKALEDVLSQYKISADDMNIIKKHLINTIHSFDIEGLNRITDRYKNILNPVIDRYEELKYDLITNGPTIKTGRKVDGKDEYAIRKTVAVATGEDKVISIDLPENARQINYDIQIMPTKSNNVVVKPGFYKSSTNFFMAYGYTNGNIQVQLGSGVDWLTDDMKYFVTVYYILNEVQ